MRYIRIAWLHVLYGWAHTYTHTVSTPVLSEQVCIFVSHPYSIILLADSGVPPPDRRGPSANTTVQSDTTKAISEPLKITPDLTALPTNTNSLYGRKLPPLGSGSHDAGHGRSGDMVKPSGIKTNHLDVSSLVSTESSGQRGRPPLGTDGADGVRQNAAVIQPCTSSDCPSSSFLAHGSQQKPPCVSGAFPTKVPDYSVEFSSDSEALSSSRVREEKEQSPADKSLRWGSMKV